MSVKDRTFSMKWCCFIGVVSKFSFVVAFDLFYCNVSNVRPVGYIQSALHAESQTWVIKPVERSHTSTIIAHTVVDWQK